MVNEIVKSNQHSIWLSGTDIIHVPIFLKVNLQRIQQVQKNQAGEVQLLHHVVCVCVCNVRVRCVLGACAYFLCLLNGKTYRILQHLRRLTSGLCSSANKTVDPNL